MGQGQALEVSSSFSSPLSTPRPWLVWTICWDRCLDLSGPSLAVLGVGEAWCLGLSPGPLWWGLGLWLHCNNVSVSFPSVAGSGECTLFQGGGEGGVEAVVVSGRRPKPPFLLFTWSRSGPELQAHIHYTNRQSQPYTHSPSPRWLRGRVMVAWWWQVLWGGQCQPLPGAPTLTLRMRLMLPRPSPGAAGVYPPVFPPSQAWGGPGHQLPGIRTPHKHKARA